MSLVLQATSGVWIISHGADVPPGASPPVFDMATLELRRTEVLELRRPADARAFVTRLAARPGHLAQLRRFAGERLPLTPAAAEEAVVMEELARFFAAGHLRASVLRAELPVLRERDVVEEAAPAPQVPVPEKVEAPPKDDICWPCLLAALASVRTLREAAQLGIPFIADGRGDERGA